MLLQTCKSSFLPWNAQGDALKNGHAVLFQLKVNGDGCCEAPKMTKRAYIKVVHVMYILNIRMMSHQTYDVKPGVLMHSFPIYIHAQLSFDSRCMVL